MQTLTVGKLAGEAGVNLETVRYYERTGLMPRPTRTDSGYRQYDGEDLLRLRFIKKAQGLGFTLKEIKELLSLRVDGRTSCQKVQKLAETKVQAIESKIRDLQRMKRTLTKLLTACHSETHTTKCPILEAIASEEEGQ